MIADDDIETLRLGINRRNIHAYIRGRRIQVDRHITDVRPRFQESRKIRLRSDVESRSRLREELRFAFLQKQQDQALAILGIAAWTDAILAVAAANDLQPFQNRKIGPGRE